MDGTKEEVRERLRERKREQKELPIPTLGFRERLHLCHMCSFSGPRNEHGPTHDDVGKSNRIGAL